MKIALISDLHGNAVALKKTLQKIDKYKVRKTFIMGDFLGYYYQHDKVFELLKQTNWQGVQGNHDKTLEVFLKKNKKAMETYRLCYGHSLDLALKILSKKQKKLILDLPRLIKIKINGKKILLCHGSPWHQNEYVYSDGNFKIFNKIFNLGYDYVFLGHTHYPFIKKKGEKMIINAGSIGQPRDWGSHSAWWIVDLKNQTAQLKRSFFSAKSLIKMVDKFDPDKQYLKNIFKRRQKK